MKLAPINGPALRRLRRAADISQAKLEILAGIPANGGTAIHKLEKGHTRSTQAKTLIAIARALGVKPSELTLEGAPPRKPRGPKPEITPEWVASVEEMDSCLGRGE
jgi:transcriptional regulator with XRE-family HTH domain